MYQYFKERLSRSRAELVRAMLRRSRFQDNVSKIAFCLSTMQRNEFSETDNN